MVSCTLILSSVVILFSVMVASSPTPADSFPGPGAVYEKWPRSVSCSDSSEENPEVYTVSGQDLKTIVAGRIEVESGNEYSGSKFINNHNVDLYFYVGHKNGHTVITYKNMNVGDGAVSSW